MAGDANESAVGGGSAGAFAGNSVGYPNISLDCIQGASSKFNSTARYIIYAHSDKSCQVKVVTRAIHGSHRCRILKIALYIPVS